MMVWTCGVRHDLCAYALGIRIDIKSDVHLFDEKTLLFL